jgi:MFS family permease
MNKPHLSFWQILNMNVGFFGIQFSFGLQQANMSPIYAYLGADAKNLPLLWLAGPVTGLLVQPIVGALSDRTGSKRGRRTPFFLIGALICSFGLLIMPFSPVLWFAAGLLWILDAANNMTMEPYRAYVSDRLNPPQHAAGFLTQSAFTGLAQTLAYLAPSIFVFMGMNKDAVNAHNIPHITIAAFIAAFAMVPFTRRFGAKVMHALCLLAAAVGMWALPGISLDDGKWLLFVPMLGVGLAWASIMGNPYVLLAGSVPPERAGVYMGIFNMFIVIPMIIQMLTLPLIYEPLLGGRPDNVIRLAGVLLACAAVAVLFVKVAPSTTAAAGERRA